jgi:20S proteasome subunit alpha 7
MTWISGLDGPTKGRHQQVPQALLEEAEKAAKKSLEGDDDDDEEAEDAMQE